MDAATEQALIERCRAGDETAFRDLVEAYQAMIFGIVARTIGDRSQAEDLAQEVFLRVHRGLRYFRGDARLSTWIYRIAANVCLQERSRESASAISIDETGRGRPLSATVGAVDPRFEELEVRERLDKALARLPGLQRFLIAGHYLGGLRYEELSAALDMPLGTVKTHLHRARRRLRELMERGEA